MYCLVRVDDNSMTAHLTISDKGVKKCCISIAAGWTDDVMCGMAVKRVEMLGGNVRKMKALAVKIESVILIGKDR
jgi:hypothetical protein